MNFFDVTKLADSGHRSGLVRVSERLRDELGRSAQPVHWHGGRRAWLDADGKVVSMHPTDWWLTVELFSRAERPGFAEWLTARPCRLAAVFHDAIPLRFPHITWPQSVQRHPDYLKLLAGFDRIWAVSEASRQDLLGFWRWQGVEPRARVEVLALGADFDRAPRAAATPPPSRPSLLCVGIIEPRKNQGFLLEVAQRLWSDGHDFDLHIVGRVNPHFGAPLERALRAAAKREPRLHLHGAAKDATLQRLYRDATAVVFPTIAEGCGLPLLEALWRGVPCVGSDLPVLRENATGGGCVLARVNDADDWVVKLGRLLGDAAQQQRLRAEAAQRPLPTWHDTAQTLRAGLR